MNTTMAEVDWIAIFESRIDSGIFPYDPSRTKNLSRIAGTINKGIAYAA
jgi:hypothetical protein